MRKAITENVFRIFRRQRKTLIPTPRRDKINLIIETPVLVAVLTFKVFYRR